MKGNLYVIKEQTY